MAKAEIKQNVPIFISSTYEDLILYRDEVQRVLMRLEQIVKGMEYFGSSPKKPLDVCIDTVKSCKVFIGIIGMRYGSVESKTHKSFTQLEYEAAIENKVPVLIYIMDDNHPIPFKYVDTGEKAKLLSDFKNVLTQNHTVSYFTTPDDLGRKVTSDLLDVLKSLDQIEIDHQNNIDIKEDFDEIFKKYMFRPAKYKMQEGILTVKISNINKSGISLKPDIVKALGLTFGDTVSVPVFVIDKDTHANLIPNYIYLYGEKELADWIEQVLPETIVRIKVRLDFCVTQEIMAYDEGSALKDVLYTNLVLLGVIE